MLQAFISAGVPVEVISLGNEITNGLLLPVGNLSSSAGFAAASEILHSAASAVRQTSPSTKTMIHLSDGWSSAEQDFFYGVRFHSMAQELTSPRIGHISIWEAGAG